MHVSQSAECDDASLPEHSSRAEALVFNNDIPITCDLCGEQFADGDTFDAHQRSEADRHPPSVRFLKGAPLPKCLYESTLYGIGWMKPRLPGKGSAQGVWRKPRMPKRRPHRIDENEVWNCLVCKKHFKDATPFLAHFVHTFTPIERCLDFHELKALDFELSKAGVWRAGIATQLLPSQARRLASVRQELEAFERVESTKRDTSELAGGSRDTPPNKAHESNPFKSCTYEGTSDDLEPAKTTSAGVAIPEPDFESKNTMFTLRQQAFARTRTKRSIA